MNPLEQDEDGLERTIRVARIVLLAASMAVGMLMVVGTAVVRPAEIPPPDVTVQIGIVAVAVLLALGSVLFRRLNLQIQRLEQVYSASGAVGLNRHLLTTTIVSAALAEAVGIVGLVLGVLMNDTYYVYLLGGISILAILFTLPRAASWRDAYNYLVVRGPMGLSGTASRTNRV